MEKYKQLNPFEIKAELNSLSEKLKGVQDFSLHSIHFALLDNQEDKTFIVKMLLREIVNVKANAPLVKFLLIRYAEKNFLTEKLWEIIKNPIVQNLSKIIALDILRDITSEWSYDECENFLDMPQELIDEDTKRLLTNAVINPEVQIDFLDFLSSLNEDDKLSLVQSLADDYSGDELANILIPVFISQPDTNVGQKALDLLGESRSKLAYSALTSGDVLISDSSKVKKAISTLKLAGCALESENFYKKLLSNSKPYKIYTALPDGEGNQALIFSRIKDDSKVQFVAVVLNDYFGIRECFGFNEISKFECDTIITKFFSNEESLSLSPETVKYLLVQNEKIIRKRDRKVPYEYVCWRNLLNDVVPENKEIKDIMEDKLKPIALTKDKFLTLNNLRFVNLWFMTPNYSDEYDLFIKNLNSQLSLNVDINLDNIIEKEFENVFYDEELELWKDRILKCAYLYVETDNFELAQNFYSLYCDKKYCLEFLKNIMKRSVYQYYVSLKQSGTEIFSKNIIDDIIKNIEKRWVQNA